VPPNYKIGIFDSGLGGLTVLKSIKKSFPHHSFLYLGDLANLPYGDKSKDSIITYSKKIVDFFIQQNIQLIIVACNSASSVALKKLQSIYSVPIIGVIRPSINTALKKTKSKSIGIIGTETTIKSQAYNNELKNLTNNSDKYSISSVSCPLFVPIVEEGWENTEIAHQIATKYLSNFKDEKIDTIILGCTHYPMLLKILKIVFNQLGYYNLTYIECADSITKLIKKLDLNTTHSCSDQFYITDTSRKFSTLANKFLGYKIPTINVISV
jgi:glutamate racemase